MSVEINFLTRNNEAWQEGFKLAFKGGAAFDFGAYRPLRLQVKASEWSTNPLLDLTEGDGLSVDDDGGLSIVVPMAAMQDLAGSYVHDIRGADSGNEWVIAHGVLVVEQGVTYTWP
jgi:hypothetical protein